VKKDSWTFILPIVGDARHEKHIKIYEKVGVNPTVYAFDRPGFPLSSDLDYTLLGTVQHGRYGRRLWSIIKAAARLWTDVDEADVVYAFGLDLLFLAWLATLWKRNGPRLVYDVADLPQKAMEGTVQGWAVRTIEGFLLSKAACLVVTSEAYLDEYFHKHYETSWILSRPLPPVPPRRATTLRHSRSESGTSAFFDAGAHCMCCDSLRRRETEDFR
jgi:hypothetical protein